VQAGGDAQVKLIDPADAYVTLNEIESEQQRASQKGQAGNGRGCRHCLRWREGEESELG
jgi:hypothetical protein